MCVHVCVCACVCVCMCVCACVCVRVPVHSDTCLTVIIIEPFQHVTLLNWVDINVCACVCSF